MLANNTNKTNRVIKLEALRRTNSSSSLHVWDNHNSPVSTPPSSSPISGNFAYGGFIICSAASPTGSSLPERSNSPHRGIVTLKRPSLIRHTSDPKFSDNGDISKKGGLPPAASKSKQKRQGSRSKQQQLQQQQQQPLQNQQQEKGASYRTTTRRQRESQQRERYEQIRQKILETVDREGIVTTIDEDDTYIPPIWMQGNLDWYSDKRIEKRESLERSSLIAAKIRKWWRFTPKNENGNVSKETYKWINKKLYLMLVPSAMEEEADICAERDWEADAKGKDEMDFRTFFTAIFEAVDMWVDDANEESYATFLDEFHQRLFLRKKNKEELALLWRSSATESEDPTDDCTLDDKMRSRPGTLYGGQNSSNNKSNKSTSRSNHQEYETNRTSIIHMSSTRRLSLNSTDTVVAAAKEATKNPAAAAAAAAAAKESVNGKNSLRASTSLGWNKVERTTRQYEFNPVTRSMELTLSPAPTLKIDAVRTTSMDMHSNKDTSPNHHRHSHTDHTISTTEQQHNDETSSNNSAADASSSNYNNSNDPRAFVDDFFTSGLRIPKGYNIKLNLQNILNSFDVDNGSEISASGVDDDVLDADLHLANQPGDDTSGGGGGGRGARKQEHHQDQQHQPVEKIPPDINNDNNNGTAEEDTAVVPADDEDADRENDNVNGGNNSNNYDNITFDLDALDVEGDDDLGFTSVIGRLNIDLADLDFGGGSYDGEHIHECLLEEDNARSQLHHETTVRPANDTGKTIEITTITTTATTAAAATTTTEDIEGRDNMLPLTTVATATTTNHNNNNNNISSSSSSSTAAAAAATSASTNHDINNVSIFSRGSNRTRLSASSSPMKRADSNMAIINNMSPALKRRFYQAVSGDKDHIIQQMQREKQDPIANRSKSASYIRNYYNGNMKKVTLEDVITQKVVAAAAPPASSSLSSPPSLYRENLVAEDQLPPMSWVHLVDYMDKGIVDEAALNAVKNSINNAQFGHQYQQRGRRRCRRARSADSSSCRLYYYHHHHHHHHSQKEQQRNNDDDDGHTLARLQPNQQPPPPEPTPQRYQQEHPQPNTTTTTTTKNLFPSIR